MLIVRKDQMSVLNFRHDGQSMRELVAAVEASWARQADRLGADELRGRLGHVHELAVRLGVKDFVDVVSLANVAMALDESLHPASRHEWVNEILDNTRLHPTVRIGLLVSMVEKWLAINARLA